MTRMFVANIFFFFFQAEDGIRDAQESRGLGDVYKRQVSTQSTGPRQFLMLRSLVVLLVVLLQSAVAWLNVNVPDTSPAVVVNGVATELWGSPRVHQLCDQYWTNFVVSGDGFVFNKSSVKVTTNSTISSPALYRYQDPAKIGVKLSCHETGLTFANLTFFHNTTGQSVSIFWMKDCVVYPVWYQLVDPGNVGMILIAVALVTWGGLRTENTVAQQIQQEMGDDAEISIKKAISFVVGASLSLLLIFYFLRMMSVLLTICFCFVSTIAVSMLVYSVLYPLSWGKILSGKAVTLPAWGPVTGLEATSLFVGVGCVVFWLLSGHWVANNILGSAICLYMMAVLRLPNIKVSAVLLTLLFCYDIFWVFYSKPIFGENVMVTAAKGLDLPIKLLLPRGFTTPCYTSSFTMLGLGDIALPGLLGVFTRRFDLAKPQLNGKFGYFTLFVVGYTVGMMTCFVVLFVFKAAQPALLYLVPGTLVTVVLFGFLRGELRELWDGFERTEDHPEGAVATSEAIHDGTDAEQTAIIMNESDEEVETAPMLNISDEPDPKEAKGDDDHHDIAMGSFKIVQD
eukprot:TRINITY_DN10452_c0_g1_i6.p1 TRINITY_DN10452_c0_g1~~TRINITY_DN10452_c0_g1_i6.p1  ORF type:complete len:568 (+),score=96.19 TRINITY_DN10452_c0_g1_i6:71-1774(+)